MRGIRSRAGYCSAWASRNAYTSASSTPGKAPAAGARARARACARSARPPRTSARRARRARGGSTPGRGRWRPPQRGLPPAEPLGVRERHADRDGERRGVRAPRLGGAPERPGRGVGVLVELGGAVVRSNAVRALHRRQTSCPSIAPVTSCGKRQPVVLVALQERAVAPHAQEVQRDVEVVRREVGEPHRRGLVRDAEGVAEVLDREVALPLRRCRNVTAHLRHRGRRRRST